MRLKQYVCDSCDLVVIQATWMQSKHLDELHTLWTRLKHFGGERGAMWMRWKPPGCSCCNLNAIEAIWVLLEQFMFYGSHLDCSNLDPIGALSADD